MPISLTQETLNLFHKPPSLLRQMNSMIRISNHTPNPIHSLPQIRKQLDLRRHICIRIHIPSDHHSRHLHQRGMAFIELMQIPPLDFDRIGEQSGFGELSSGDGRADVGKVFHGSIEFVGDGSEVLGEEGEVVVVSVAFGEGFGWGWNGVFDVGIVN